MNRRDDKNYMEHCADQRCERLECENLYLRNQLEQILKEIRQPNPSATNFIQQKINSVASSSSDRLFNSVNNTTLPRQRHTTTQCQKCSLDEAVGSQQCSSGSQTPYTMAASTPCRHQEQQHLHQQAQPLQQQQRTPQNSNVVSRRLRLIEEELAAFKQDLSTMLHQPTTTKTTRHVDEKSTSEMASYSGWYSDRGATSSVVPLKFDQQVQTSPSDTPSHWPPPSVHGSPRRKPTTLVKQPRDVPSPAVAPRLRSHPVRADLLKWATSRPGCRLAKARYSYKPLRDSPNNYPELELSLEPGDYLLLFGNLDDDYFYHGELFNGQQGLVPSNYIEIIEDDGRSDSMNLNLNLSRERLDSDFMANHFLQHNGADFTNKSFMIHQDSTTRSSTLPETGCPYPSGDVCGVTVHEARQLDGGARVPNPREISVERQLTKSILISWSPPYNTIIPVTHYHVCIDGVVRAVVPGGYKTKALIENVDINKATRVSVRTVTEMGHSADAACTVTIGKIGVSVAAQELKVSNVTPNSVNVSWYPSNSNIEHMVLLNGLKIGTCPPGVYQVQLKGLLNSTMYRCTVRVKDPKAVLEEKPLETHVDFKTLPRVGLPDPPQNVQCEFGPQDGTILVTWQPIINGSQSHSKYGVAGYLVYADGKLITEITSPSGDHAVLHWSTLSNEPPLFVSVKAKARDGSLSADSETVRVPRAIGNVRSRTMEGLNMPSTTLHSNMLTSATSYYNVMNPNPVPLTTGLSQSGQSLGGNYANFQSNLQQNAVNASNFSNIQQMYNPTAIMPQMGGGGITTLDSNTAANMIPGVRYPVVASMGGSYSSNPMMAPNALTASLIRPNQSSSNLDSSATSYYVFHPRLTQVDSSCLEKPSLLEMETNYLVRHQRRQQRSQAFGNRRSYSLNDEDHYQQINSIPHSNSLLGADKRQYALVPVNRQFGSTRACDVGTVVYSDDDWNYPRLPPSLSIEKPLIARYRRKLRQVDSRAFSEPDLRTDPRLMALRPKARPRYVVAMYDYNPSHMSPNPNGAQEELPFRKGQTILIIGDKDSDGFYHGELAGRSGLVPSNLVLETESDQQRMLRRSDVSPSYSDVPSYPTYSKRLPQPSAFARSSDIVASNHPVDPYYAPRKHFISSELDRWGHNASDPSLSRSRHLDYDSPPIPSSVERDRYNVGVAGGSGHSSDSRSRRMKFKQKSHSLDYDIEREEFLEREAAYQRRTHGDAMPRDIRASHGVHSQHFAPNDRDRNYPRQPDEYSPRYRRDIDDERNARLPRDAAGEYYGSLPRLPYRTRDEYRDETQDPIYDGHRYVDSNYSPRQQRIPGRYSDASPGAYGGDSDNAYSSMRKLPQNREMDREGRRRGSFRRGGRDALEQTIIETVRGAPPRRFLAKFDYDPKENSPNPGAELDELNFRTGDAITVYGEMDEDGFFIGELNGRRGLVPSNFLTFDTPNPKPESQQIQQSTAIPTDENFETVVPALVTKSRKDGVSFSADTRSVDSNGPQTKQPSPKTTPKGAAGTKPAGKAGQLKKADSTTSNKPPQKKMSTASAPGAIKKPVAAAAGKPATAPTAKKK